MNKVNITRNSILRSKFGGYARLIKDGVLGESIYVKKNTVFRVSTLNLFTQTVIAINEATKVVVSLDYDYIINSCDLINTENTSEVINGLAIVDLTESNGNPNMYTYVLIALGCINIILSVLFACVKF